MQKFAKICYNRGMDKTESDKLPAHIGFILDGNRRWAKARNLPTLEGHKKGYDTLLKLAYVARDAGIQYVSAFTFSTENWSRSKKEVDYLMDLALWAFGRDMKRLVDDGFRIVFLGRSDGVRAKIREKIIELEKLSEKNSGTTLALCFNYGGRAEIIDASKRIAEAFANGEITEQQLKNFGDNDFANFLYHPEIPACDLIVRTSGEERISGFQLWRAAYAEFLFIDKAWPEFDESDFANCLAEFARRNRRMGK